MLWWYDILEYSAPFTNLWIVFSPVLLALYKQADTWMEVCFEKKSPSCKLFWSWCNKYISNKYIKSIRKNLQYYVKNTIFICCSFCFTVNRTVFPKTLSLTTLYGDLNPQWFDKGHSSQRAASTLKPLIGPGQFRSHLCTLSFEWQKTHNGLNHPHTGYTLHSSTG